MSGKDDHKWKKGANDNPGGKPKLPADVKAYKKFTYVESVKILSIACWMTKEEMFDRISDPNTPLIELAILSNFAMAIKNGDSTRLNMILDRVIGKVTERVEYNLPQPTVVKLVDEDASVIIGRIQQEQKEES